MMDVLIFCRKTLMFIVLVFCLKTKKRLRNAYSSENGFLSSGEEGGRADGGNCGGDGGGGGYD